MNIIKYVVKTRSDSSAGEYFLDREGVGGSNPSQIILKDAWQYNATHLFLMIFSIEAKKGCRDLSAALFVYCFFMISLTISNDRKRAL